jgi:hypothetical protein
MVMRLDLDEKIEAGEAMPLVTLHGSNGNADLFMKGYGLFCEVYGDNLQQNHKPGCRYIFHKVEDASDESLDVQLYKDARTIISEHATTSTTFRKSVGELVMIMLQSGYTVEAVVPEKESFRF